MDNQFSPVEYTRTLDGACVELAASVDSAAEARRAFELGAQSIGLLRSEPLYQSSPTVPDEEELFAFYQEIVTLAQGKRVIARIADLGGNIRPDYLHLAPERNPAMGLRSIRMVLSRQEVFLPQLRAMLRASQHGVLAVLAPMVSTVDEVLRLRRLLEEVNIQLEQEGKQAARGVKLGVMIENPAAVIVSDLIARYVDFFCIDTHTLTQYTLVTDRNSMLYSPNEARGISVLRYMSRALDNARDAGIWTSVIGDSAADPQLLPSLLGLGVSVLSVEPQQLADTRTAVHAIHLSATRERLLRELSSPGGNDSLNNIF